MHRFDQLRSGESWGTCARTSGRHRTAVRLRSHAIVGCRTRRPTGRVTRVPSAPWRPRVPPDHVGSSPRACERARFLRSQPALRMTLPAKSRAGTRMIGPMPGAERLLPCPEPFDVGLTFGPLEPRPLRSVDPLHGPRVDPCDALTGRRRHRVPGRRIAAAAVVRVQAWGPGEQWVVAHAADIAGLARPPVRFRPARPDRRVASAAPARLADGSARRRVRPRARHHRRATSHDGRSPSVVAWSAHDDTALRRPALSASCFRRLRRR